MNRRNYILFFTFLVLALTSQTKNDWTKAEKAEIIAAYQKACDWFVRNNSYSFNLNYTSYKDHLSKEIIESSNGYYKRSSNKFVSHIMGIKTIQNSTARIVIDSSDKLIAITDPGSLNPTLANTEQLTEMLNNVKGLKKRVSNEGVTYKIDFLKNSLFDSYEFSVDKSGLLDKLVYFYSEQEDKDYGGETDDGHLPITSKIKPRLEVVFSKYQYPIKANSNDFEIKGLVLADNRKISLNDNFKSYSVKDYRTIKK